MPIRRWNAPSVTCHAGTTRLLRILVAALGCQVWGCANAKVSDIGPRADGGTGDTGSSANGKDTSSPNDKNTKNDGATTGVCDPFSNARCDSGMKCTALQQGTGTLTLGCDARGSKAEGETCTQTTSNGAQTGDDCDNGLACFSTQAGTSATCHRMCATSGTANGCPGSEICSLVAPGLTTVAFCRATTSCQPLEQTGCPSADQACYFSSTGALCAQEGTKNPGDACSAANDCAKGSTCLTVGAAGTCSSFCSTASGGTPSCSGSSTGGSICAALGGSSDEPNLGSCR